MAPSALLPNETLPILCRLSDRSPVSDANSFAAIKALKEQLFANVSMWLESRWVSSHIGQHQGSDLRGEHRGSLEYTIVIILCYPEVQSQQNSWESSGAPAEEEHVGAGLVLQCVYLIKGCSG